MVDEVHALCDNKRGVHLAVSLERLEARVALPLQRGGCSATLSPLEDIAAFLVSCEEVGRGRRCNGPSPPSARRRTTWIACSGAAVRIAGPCPCAPTCSPAMDTQELPEMVARIKDEVRVGQPVPVHQTPGLGI